MGCIFCCFKKKKRLELPNDIKDHLLPKSVEYKKQVLELCISEDKRYKFLLNDIKGFTDDQINKLFNAQIPYIINYDPPPSYKENNYEFNSLLERIEENKTILQEWYKDPSKYEIIKKFWLTKYKISDLVDKTESEKDQILNEIFQGDISQEDLLEFNNIIKNSPESKAIEIHRELKYYNYDFYSLIKISSENYKNIKKEYNAKFTSINSIYMDKEKDIIEKLISNFVELKNILPKKFQNYEVCRKIYKIIEDKIQNEKENIFGISFESIYNLAYRFKNGNIIANLLKDIKSYYQNPIINITSIAFSFLNLYQSISSFYKSGIKYNGKKEVFAERLNTIQSNFREHIYKINNFNIKNTDNLKEAESLIIEIGREVEQDRIDIINLSNDIKNEIEDIKNKNKKNAGKIAGTVIGTVGCFLGTVSTGGTLGLFFLMGTTANAVATGYNAANYVENKKHIKDFQDMLKETNKQYKKIQNTIEELEKKYNEIQNMYR